MKFSSLAALCLALVFAVCIPALAVPDYSASIPCEGAATLTPPDSIVRVKGVADTLQLEAQAQAGVNLTIGNWKINGAEIFYKDAHGNINMTQAGSDWGIFTPENDMKTLNWTLAEPRTANSN